MNRKNLSALFIATIVSVSVYGAAVWVGSQYIETFQNGFLFGNFNILKVSNEVPEYEDASGIVKRLDDMNPNRIKLEDFESDIDSADFLCGANLTASNETTAPIRGITSIDIDQGATAASAAAICDSQPITLEDKHQGKFVGVCFYTMWDGNDNEMAINIVDNTNTVELVQVMIRASTEPLEHCGYFNTATDTATVDYDIEVLTGNNNTTLRLDDVQLVVDPLTPTDIYASDDEIYNGEITFSATTTAPTKATSPNTDNMVCNRAGSLLNCRVAYRQSSATGAAAGSGAYLIQLPNSLSVDSSKVKFYTGTLTGDWVTDNVVGTGTTFDAGVNEKPAVVSVYDANHVRFFDTEDDQSIGSGWRPLSLAQVGYVFKFSVPIAGWSNTAQGVVVKNRTDSASVENVFSATVDANLGTASGDIVSENISGWLGAIPYAVGEYTVNFQAGLFSVAPSCTATSRDTGGTRDLRIYGETATSIKLATYGGGGVAQYGFSIKCQRQGTDYIKETDKVYTVDVSQLKGNSCKLEGNDGRVITVVSESIPFDGNCVGWTSGANGSTGTTGNYYEVQENNSVVEINGHIQFTSIASRVVEMTLNGVVYRRIGDFTNLSNHNFNFISKRGEFNKDDKLALILAGSGGTLNSVTLKGHYLNINETYGDKGVYLGTFGQPTCYVKDVKASGTGGGSVTLGVWTERDLNTTEGDCSFLTLSGNDFTLESGGYNLECKAPAYAINRHKSKLYDVTNAADFAIGSSEIAGPTAAIQSHSFIETRVNISSSTAFDIRTETQATRATSGLGIASSFGEDEVYTICKITKVR